MNIQKTMECATLLLEELRGTGVSVFHSPVDGLNVVMEHGTSRPGKVLMDSLHAMSNAIGLMFCLDMIDQNVANQNEAKRLKEQILASIEESHKVKRANTGEVFTRLNNQS